MREGGGGRGSMGEGRRSKGGEVHGGGEGKWGMGGGSEGGGRGGEVSRRGYVTLES